MATYTIKSGQTIYDVAIQLYGDAGKTPQLVSDNLSVLNNGLMTTNLVGVIVSYTDPNTSITNYFRTNNIIITSGTTTILTNRAFNDAFNQAFG